MITRKLLVYTLLGMGCLALKAQRPAYTQSSDSLVNQHASNFRIFTAVRTEQRPRTDGRLDDACWQDREGWTGGFVQQQPAQGQPPSQQTEVKILYDDHHLFVAMKCHDNEPGKISALLGRRDDFSTGDVAGIALDTYHDLQTALEFNVSAAGQKIDLIHRGAGDWDTNWNAVWEGKAHVEDSLWTVEIEIPFSQLRFDDSPRQVWGMHIWRWIDRLDEEDQWKLIPVDAPSMVYLFGELHGLENIRRGKKLELMPFGALRYVQGNPADRFGLGLDAKVSLASNFTLDFTAFPDFGQVEADPSELNLTAYEVFYEEKRPFFLEGTSILDYSAGNDLLFYSRRIGHAPGYTPALLAGETLTMPPASTLLNALKITGKTRNGLSLGIVNSMTDREFATIEAPGESRREAVEPFTNYSVVRVRKDLNQGNSLLGGMMTSTIRSIRDPALEYLPSAALAGGVDILHQWKNRSWFAELKSFYSRISGSEKAVSRLQLSNIHLYQREDAGHLDFDPERRVLEGWGGIIRGGKQSGKFRATATLSWRSPGVDLNDAGYLRDADLVQQRLNLRYQVNKPSGILRNWYLFADQRHDWSYGGENLNNVLILHGYFKFSNLWSLHLDGNRTFGKTDTRQLRGGPSLRIDPSAHADLFLQTNSADKVFLGAGLYKKWFDRGLGSDATATFYLQWKISNRLFLTSESQLGKTTDYNQYAGQKTFQSSKRYLTGLLRRETFLTTLRAEYFLSPELSIQFYGSPYASTGRYPALRRVADAHARDIEKRYLPLVVTGSSGDQLWLDESYDGVADYPVLKPDFNFREFRSNLVVRWEYKAGSTLYLVWSHNRSAYDVSDQGTLWDCFGSIPEVSPENALMVKLSYWFSL